MWVQLVHLTDSFRREAGLGTGSLLVPRGMGSVRSPRWFPQICMRERPSFCQSVSGEDLESFSSLAGSFQREGGFVNEPLLIPACLRVGEVSERRADSAFLVTSSAQGRIISDPVSPARV